jgi:hypothetical protein
VKNNAVKRKMKDGAKKKKRDVDRRKKRDADRRKRSVRGRRKRDAEKKNVLNVKGRKRGSGERGRRGKPDSDERWKK